MGVFIEPRETRYETMSQGVLSDVKVLDLSRVLAGPWAAQTLADMGADVIKVEQPDVGDDTRKWGPPFAQDEHGRLLNDSAYFMCANRGKRSVCIDFKSEQGQDDIKRLASSCDVLIENFTVGQLKKYNLDYSSLSKINPKLIYCSITGFGQTGPSADRPGYDFMIQGMSGLMSVTGEKGGTSTKVGVAVTDVLTGLYASVAILSALHERKSSGLGQHIDLALYDVAVASMANQATNYLIGGIVPQTMGNAHPNIVPYQSFVTKKGECIVAVGNDSQFKRFCSALGKPELADQASFKTNQDRVSNRDELIAMISRIMLDKTAAQWFEVLESHQVPYAPVNNMQEVFEDPQIKHRKMTLQMTHAEAGRIDLVANPINFSRTPIQYQTPPPTLGEHTDEVLNPTKDKSQVSG